MLPLECFLLLCRKVYRAFPTIRYVVLLLLIGRILGSLFFSSWQLDIYLLARETIQIASVLTTEPLLPRNISDVDLAFGPTVSHSDVPSIEPRRSPSTKPSTVPSSEPTVEYGGDYIFPELRLLPPVLREHSAPQARINQAHRDRPAGVFVELQHSIAATIEQIVYKFMKPWETDYPNEVFLPDTLIQAQANDPALRNNTLLVQIENGTANFSHLFDPPTRHPRRQSLEDGIQKLLKLDQMHHPRTLPDKVTFLVTLNDGFKTSVPTFTSARHWSNITVGVPVPLGNLRGYNEGWGSTIVGWDAYVRQHIASHHNEIPWNKKIPKAVFRGAYSPFKYKLGTCNIGLDLCELPKSWRDVNRGKLFTIASQATSLFDVGFNKIRADRVKELALENVTIVPSMSLVEQQRYKYVINMGNNADWAERLRHLFYTDMLVVRHEAETQEWFYPALQPYVHYLPVRLTLDDLIEQVQWAKDHDTAAREMAQNGFAFAQHFLSEKVMLHYWTVALQKFARLQKDAYHKSRSSQWRPAQWEFDTTLPH